MKKTKNRFGGTAGAVIAAVCIVIYLAALVQGAVRIYKSVDMRQAVAGIFDYETVTQILKETLVLVLIGFIIAFFTMLLQLLFAKPAASSGIGVSAPASKKESKPDNPEDSLEYDDFESVHKTYKKSFNEPIEESFKMPFNDPIEDTFKMPFNEPHVESSNEPVNFENKSFSAEDDSGKDLSGDAPVPKGLYSPRSNIGWEEYTKERLHSELQRCSSTEQDLTLLMIEFADSLSDIQFKQAAEEAVSFFASRDLLFEKQQGITVIVPGVDLEAGLSKARIFQKRISEKLFSDRNAGDCVYIGLSSRAGRLLDETRFLLEASEALARAKEDSETSIIAFKSDPEKYRNFIRTRT